MAGSHKAMSEAPLPPAMLEVSRMRFFKPTANDSSPFQVPSAFPTPGSVPVLVIGQLGSWAPGLEALPTCEKGAVLALPVGRGLDDGWLGVCEKCRPAVLASRPRFLERHPRRWHHP